MSIGFVEAMRETLSGWQDDLPPAWKAVLADVRLGFDAADQALELEPWEPIFPARRDKHFPGAPAEAHMFRAFDGIEPGGVRCVILGQDPYPEPGFSTGRAFEAGNVAAWRELDKMFSKSVRAFIQLICAARTGDDGYAASFADWPRTLAAIEAGDIGLEPPGELADRWVGEGVVLLNASLTLTRFDVDVDAHQSRGHLPIWRPLIVKVLSHLAGSGRPIVFLGFGDAAAGNLKRAGLAGPGAPLATVLRDHPAAADKVLGRENPLVVCNRHLKAIGEQPIAW